MSLSKPIKHSSFNQDGELNEDIINEHIVPSLGIGATDTIKKSGWNGNTPAFAVGLVIGPTGENIRSAKAFGVGYHANSWTIPTEKVWGGQAGFKLAVNLKDNNNLSFPSNTMYTNYIDSSNIAWYVFNTNDEKSKLAQSEYTKHNIGKFCIRASVKLLDGASLARISYAIVPVSLDELKKEYLHSFDKAGFPNIAFRTKDIPFVPIAEDDWQLPSPIVPLFLDERTSDNRDILPEADEIWLKFAQFLRSTTSPNLVNSYDDWVKYLSDNPTFEASPSEYLWPLPGIPKKPTKSASSGSGKN